jgi:hypothetical protein
MIAPPPAESREQDVIQKTLNAIGVMYSHHNDEILVPSRIEEERTKKMLVCGVFCILSAAAYDVQKTRRRISKPSSAAQGSAPTQWPPKRRHHKPPLTPEQQYVIHDLHVIVRLSFRSYRLASRHQALIELGMINRPSDVPTFARDL